MNLIYAAYGRAGLEALEILLKRDDVRIHCFTYDIPENRGLLEALQQKGVPFTTQSLTLEQARKAFVKTDAVISMHYRDRIPTDVLSWVSGRAMNLHPSLLPRYRGAFSGVWMILNGETEAGITYHLMDEKFDNGNILLQKKFALDGRETGHSLFNKSIDEGLKYFPEACELLFAGAKGVPQTGTPTYFPRRVPYDGKIDPAWDERTVRRYLRALYYPGKPAAHMEKQGRLYPVETYDDYKELVAAHAS